MPLDPTDPYYLAEVTPASIGQLGRGLCTAYNRPSSAFGSKGNTVHYSGYHRSRRWILKSADSNYGSRDYSVIQAADKSGDEDWVSAFDFTPGSWGTPSNRALMRELTGRVYNAAKARDPRLSSLREFAGTINGTSVITFNCADGSLKGAFDSSHLDHIHGSLWRSRAANDHSGILAVMLGDDMAHAYESAEGLYAKLLYEDWSPTRAEWLAAGGDGATYDLLAQNGSGRNNLRLHLDAQDAAIASVLAAVGAIHTDLSPADRAAIVADLSTAVLADLAPKIGQVVQIATEAALRKVLGSLDGATPTG